MTSQLFTLRFPARTEFWYSDTAPTPGLVVDRDGTRFVVTASEEFDDGQIVVTLETASPIASSPLEPDC